MNGLRSSINNWEKDHEKDACNACRWRQSRRRCPSCPGAERHQDIGAAIAMLESSVGRELGRLGIGNVDVMSLSLGQLAKIRLIPSTDDMDRQQQLAQVQSIVRQN
jgi:hypothetical protein